MEKSQKQLKFLTQALIFPSPVLKSIKFEYFVDVVQFSEPLLQICDEKNQS